jgi:hypothetical protein
MWDRYTECFTFVLWAWRPMCYYWFLLVHSVNLRYNINRPLPLLSTSFTVPHLYAFRHWINLSWITYILFTPCIVKWKSFSANKCTVLLLRISLLTRSDLGVKYVIAELKEFCVHSEPVQSNSNSQIPFT